MQQREKMFEKQCGHKSFDEEASSYNSALAASQTTTLSQLQSRTKSHTLSVKYKTGTLNLFKHFPFSPHIGLLLNVLFQNEQKNSETVFLSASGILSNMLKHADSQLPLVLCMAASSYFYNV